MDIKIPQDKVCLDSVKKALATYGYKITNDENPNYFYTKSEAESVFLISLPEDQLHLEISCKFYFPEEWSTQERLEFCNTLSNKLVYFSFFVNKDSELLCLAFLPYWQHLDIPTLLNFLRRLSHCAFTINNHPAWSELTTPYRMPSDTVERTPLSAAVISETIN